MANINGPARDEISGNSSGKSSMDRIRSIFVAIACIWTALSVVLIAVIVIVFRLGGFNHENKSIRNSETIPPYVMAVSQLNPEFIRSLQREFLVRAGNARLLDHRGFLNILVALDTLQSCDSSTCILYGDAFQDCSCPGEKIDVFRYIYSKGAEGDRWNPATLTNLTLARYFSPFDVESRR